MNTNILVNNGVNLEASLSLLGDMSLYNETLDTFLKDSDERLRNIIKSKQLNDMNNYSILVHSLKSDSKYLGFDLLANLSYQHELASKSNDINFINLHFNELINELARIVFICKQYKGIFNSNELNKILVVDDSSIIRNFVKKIFKDEYEVLSAQDGNEAIEIVKKYKVSCVLLDLNMPDCNGFEVLEYFKQNNLFKTIPVSLLTGDDTKESIDKAFNYPIVDMVSKPFNESSVRAIVDKMISVHNFD
jgi:CheY-like chemotaxis protein